MAERRRVARGRGPARYSALALLRHGVADRPWAPAWRAPELKRSHGVVIIGVGVHGLAPAYYLARNHGITDVAVLDKGYLGGGGSGRNTAILRSNYLTPEGVRFYDRSLQLYRGLAADLNFNVMFSRKGHLTLAHSDTSLRTMRWRAEVDKACGVDSKVIAPQDVRRHIRPAVEAILEQCDGCADVLLDVEHRTAMRRFLAWAARTDPKVFARRGSPVCGAAAVAWVITTGNRTAGVWSAEMTAKDLLAHFGVTGSVFDRAGTLMRAAGLPTGGATSSVELGDPGLLLSARRRRLMQSCDKALAEG